MFAALLIGQVPEAWGVAYPSQKPLGSWLRDLQQRCAQMRVWIESEMPKVCVCARARVFATGAGPSITFAAPWPPDRRMVTLSCVASSRLRSTLSGMSLFIDCCLIDGVLVLQVFWLSGFTYPTGFLTALLQTSARRNGVSIDTLAWEFPVLNQPADSITAHPKEGACCFLQQVLVSASRPLADARGWGGLG